MGRGGKKKKSDSAWVGKYSILVRRRINRVRSEWFVVDLKKNTILMKHPQAVYSHDPFDWTAVLHEGTLSVLNMGVDQFLRSSSDRHRQRPFAAALNNEEKEDDYIHSCSSDSDSNTFTSTLDLTKCPPIWSNWTPATKMISYSPISAVLHNQLFVCHHTSLRFNKLDVYQMGGSDSKWEEITIPFDSQFTPNDEGLGWHSIVPISDPNKNRLLIAFFGNKDQFLYAYYPKNKNNNEQWELLHQLLFEGHKFFYANTFAKQLVLGDTLILGYNPYDRFFIAYNIITNKWLQVVGLFDYDVDDYDDDPYHMYFNETSKLLHLGDDILCLANSFVQYPDFKAVIKFLRFSVNLVQQEKQLVVRLTPLSFHPISIDDDNNNGVAHTFIPF